jgi:hypothetical protein
MRRITMLLSVAGSLAGCVDDRVDGVLAEVLVFESADPVDGSGRYALRPVELEHLGSLAQLRDDVFRFLDHPVIVDFGESQIASLVADTPVYAPRVVDRAGVAIPRDAESLIALSTYHALRTAYDGMEQTSGLSFAELTPARGFPIMFRPTIESELLRERMSANAFYVSPGAFFGIPDSDAIEQIPLASLLPVLGHELGHHLFDLGFQQRLAEAALASTGEIRGFNEGWADFHAFALTGVTDLFADAIPALAESRGLDPDRGHFLAFTFDSIAACTGGFYCLGTLFARALFGAFLADGGDRDDAAQRAAYAREVFAAIAAVPAQLEGADLIGSFLRGTVGAMPPGRRPALCDHLARHFGQAFPAQAVCP